MKIFVTNKKLGKNREKSTSRLKTCIKNLKKIKFKFNKKVKFKVVLGHVLHEIPHLYYFPHTHHAIMVQFIMNFTKTAVYFIVDND